MTVELEDAQPPVVGIGIGQVGHNHVETVRDWATQAKRRKLRTRFILRCNAGERFESGVSRNTEISLHGRLVTLQILLQNFRLLTILQYTQRIPLVASAFLQPHLAGEASIAYPLSSPRGATRYRLPRWSSTSTGVEEIRPDFRPQPGGSGTRPPHTCV